VRSGGERARVDSGGLLWYGAKLCAMVASLMQAESVGVGSSAERGSVWKGIQESVHESLFVGILLSLWEPRLLRHRCLFAGPQPVPSPSWC
jgi:hypothetical protein